MAAIVFPFTMELLVVVLFSLVAIPVWLATRLFEFLDAAMNGTPQKRESSANERTR